MKDGYSHADNSLVYVEENVPGPSEQSKEYEILNTEYNSQVTHSCECVNCIELFCKCLGLTGGINNYNPVEEKYIVTYRLNKLFNLDTGFIVECNDLCSCTEDCGNRLVQKGPVDCLFVKDCNNLKGLGLFTRNSIAQGTFICEYAGELLTKSQAIARNNLNQRDVKMNYIFCLNEHCGDKTIQTFVDPSCIGNIGRYINHSCDPNCRIIPVRVNSPIPKLAIFSSKDISPETELTFDYGCNNVDILLSGKDDRRKQCLCGSTQCRGVMPLDVY